MRWDSSFTLSLYSKFLFLLQYFEGGNHMAVKTRKQGKLPLRLQWIPRGRNHLLYSEESGLIMFLMMPWFKIGCTIFDEYDEVFFLKVFVDSNESKQINAFSNQIQALQISKFKQRFFMLNMIVNLEQFLGKTFIKQFLIMQQYYLSDW